MAEIFLLISLLFESRTTFAAIFQRNKTVNNIQYTFLTLQWVLISGDDESIERLLRFE